MGMVDKLIARIEALVLEKEEAIRQFAYEREGLMKDRRDLYRKVDDLQLQLKSEKDSVAYYQREYRALSALVEQERKAMREQARKEFPPGASDMDIAKAIVQQFYDAQPSGAETRIPAIKRIREVLGIGLKEAKDLAEEAGLSLGIYEKRDNRVSSKPKA